MGLNSNEKIRAYLDSVCTHIKWKAVHYGIREELLSHITERVEEYKNQGKSDDEAIHTSIQQMGDPCALGMELAKIHRPKTEWFLPLMASLMVVFGIFILYKLQEAELIADIYFNQSVLFAAAGIIIMVITWFVDYRKLLPFSKHLFAAITLIFLFSIELGPYCNGMPFIKLFGISISPVSISSYLYIIAIAGILAKIDWEDKKSLITAAGLLAIPTLLYLYSSSLSAAILYFIAFLALLLASKAKTRQIMPLLSGFVGIIAFILISHPYRLAKITAFINPQQNPTGEGWLYLQLSNIINSAGWFGHGFYIPQHFLPELHTDFIFSYIVYSLGWAAGALLFITVLLISIRLFKITLQLTDNYGNMLVLGLGSLLFLQFVWSMFMVLGMAPIIGISLPFISYTGSGRIVQFFAVGLIMSVYRWEKIARPCSSAVGS